MHINYINYFSDCLSIVSVRTTCSPLPLPTPDLMEYNCFVYLNKISGCYVHFLRSNTYNVF